MAKTTKEKIEELTQYPIYASWHLSESEIEALAITLEDYSLAMLTKLMLRRDRMIQQMAADLLSNLPRSGRDEWISAHRSAPSDEASDPP